jgi:F0F1-type ATP synthase assembly protein I
MRLTPDDPKELGRYLALANVGLEMVVPIGVGAALDHYLDWAPWGAAGGAVFGLVLGLTHVILMSRNEEARERRDRPPRENP